MINNQWLVTALGCGCLATLVYLCVCVYVHVSPLFRDGKVTVKLLIKLYLASLSLTEQQLRVVCKTTLPTIPRAAVKTVARRPDLAACRETVGGKANCSVMKLELIRPPLIKSKVLCPVLHSR